MGIEISWHALLLYKCFACLSGDRLESDDKSWFSILLAKFVVGSIVDIGTFVDTRSYTVSCQLSNNSTSTLCQCLIYSFTIREHRFTDNNSFDPSIQCFFSSHDQLCSLWIGFPSSHNHTHCGISNHTLIGNACIYFEEISCLQYCLIGNPVHHTTIY